ncbi:hypothetical protein CEXT_112051 [Caerostris extrusa]|uniref:Uncharacterized protein n=1 Tax=Caerostris extrusa TaxID=172846 RepID=A0AAV4M6C5_CAEEX|nr:hypothetical protein CEXT_112051 [Caerostris extrusa]
MAWPYIYKYEDENPMNKIMLQKPEEKKRKDTVGDGWTIWKSGLNPRESVASLLHQKKKWVSTPDMFLSGKIDRTISTSSPLVRGRVVGNLSAKSEGESVTTEA